MMKTITFLSTSLLLWPVVQGFQTIGVFGGSGFVGRQVCERLVRSGHRVISFSKSGRPPARQCKGKWANEVKWIKADLGNEDDVDLIQALPKIDAVVSCVEDLEPHQAERPGIFGMGLGTTKPKVENEALLKEDVFDVAKSLGAERFAFVSVGRIVATLMEKGHVDEEKPTPKDAASKMFGADNTVIVEPHMISEKKHIAAGLLGGTSPVSVSDIAKILSAAAIGQINRSLVNESREMNGKGNLDASDALLIDSGEIERLSVAIQLKAIRPKNKSRNRRSRNQRRSRSLNNPFGARGPVLA